MIYRKFGGTEISVSEIGVGCGGLGGENKLGLEPVIERAIELGINFFDTCDTYAESRSEQTLGRVFRNHPRDRFVICTKFGGVIDDKGWHRDMSVAHLREAFAASCRRLGTDYFDIYLVHTPPRDILKEQDLIEELDKMVAQGKIRTYGLSVERGDFATEFVSATRGRAIEIAFNLFAQDPRRGFLDITRKKGVGVIAKTPIDKGLLSSSFDPCHAASVEKQMRRLGDAEYRRRVDLWQALKPILTANGRTMTQGALGWLLTFPEVSTVIPGITSLARIEETASAAGIRLSPSEMAQIDRAMG